MLTVTEAREIGKRSCIDLLGRDNVVQRKDTACVAYGPDFVNGKMRYFIGISDGNVTGDPTRKINTGNTPYEYRALVDVDQKTGDVDVIECVAPAVS